MNNKLILILAFVLVIWGCKNSSVEISGKLTNVLKGEYLYLAELMSNKIQTVDSLQVPADGKFFFSRDVKIPTFYLLKINNKNFFMLLTEPGEKFRMTASFDSINHPISISGSKGTQKMVDYNNALKNSIDKRNRLSEIYSQNIDSPDLPKVMQSLDSMSQQYLNEINVYTKKYIDDNLTSLVSLVALYQQYAPSLFVLNPIKDVKYFVKVDSSLFSLYPESEPVKALHEQVQTLVAGIKLKEGLNSMLHPGDIAPDITLPSPGGEIIKLSSTRGNIVLVDFWASWCNPCRLENPNLVKAYDLYRSKGFQIFQVSLDKTKEDWLKGIENDKLGRWIHVSDVKYWNSTVVSLYKIESIPFNLLLDKEGKIIAMNLRGDKLLAELESVLKEYT
jgi:thiol-disulfide isomerase/thioredoxin